jgi:hypothetical protein
MTYGCSNDKALITRVIYDELSRGVEENDKINYKVNFEKINKGYARVYVYFEVKGAGYTQPCWYYLKKLDNNNWRILGYGTGYVGKDYDVIGVPTGTVRLSDYYPPDAVGY